MRLSQSLSSICDKTWRSSEIRRMEKFHISSNASLRADSMLAEKHPDGGNEREHEESVLEGFLRDALQNLPSEQDA